MTADNFAKPITMLYPAYTVTVNKAKLLPKHILTIGELQAREVEYQEKQHKVNEAKEERKDDKKVFLCWVMQGSGSNLAYSI
eukprot:3670158-Ditylum_brightwellii.AAC.1